MRVNILGTKYRIIIATNEEKPKLNECDGYMDPTIKEIVVGKFEECPMSVEDLQTHTKNVMRHEITHAFLHESGLWTNSGNVENWGAFRGNYRLDRSSVPKDAESIPGSKMYLVG